MRYDDVKRAIDLCGALIAIVVLAPVFAVIAAIVKARLGSPVLFRQTRPGLAGRPFMLVKFRTMRDAVDDQNVPLSDVARLTAFGQRLRGSSLDELPELFNVVRGEMSFVGPRPLLLEYLPLYSPQQARRHLVRPGLTGLAQVSGRNMLDWNERLALDVWYVDHRSFLLDLKILVLTIMRVFTRHGVTPVGHETMPKFRGTT